MQSTTQPKTLREKLDEDLKYWADKKAHFEKQGKPERVKVCNLLLNKYLDDLLELPQCLR